MDLTELTDKEIELISKVNVLSGTMEDKTRKLETMGIFNEYKIIYNRYLNLAKTNPEALKRTFFLYWYSLSEPSCYSGIPVLQTESINIILSIINEKIKINDTDSELNWMLSYYSTCGFILDNYKDYSEIQKMFKLNIEVPDKINREEMKKRGQMGNYWNSLLCFSN